jgi:hypothetical protein
MRTPLWAAVTELLSAFLCLRPRHKDTASCLSNKYFDFETTKDAKSAQRGLRPQPKNASHKATKISKKSATRNNCFRRLRRFTQPGLRPEPRAFIALN